jgi:hypothetical protein
MIIIEYYIVFFGGGVKEVETLERGTLRRVGGRGE